MSPTILLLGTFDTKGDEYRFVRDRILERSVGVLTMDLGVLSPDSAPPFPIDISASEVARAGGARLAELRERRDRGAAIECMQTGARILTRELHRAGRLSGAMGLGGGGGSSMISAALRELPVGVPKLLVSTMASGNVAPYVDVKDLTLMYSVVDIAGLNPISLRILENAAGAICGMVQGRKSALPAERPLVAASMFGVTTPCVTAARKRLEAAGYDVVVFHATGSGGRAMEGLIDDGYFAGVLDVTTTEWCDEVVGGVLSAGPDRLSAAGRAGIPQVVSVGALDMVNFGPEDTIPERFRHRRFYRHNPAVTLMRTTAAENREIGERIAGQLAHAKGPVRLVLPLGGVSMLDAPGQPFHDPGADRALFDSLRRNAGPTVPIEEVDLHINDPGFAETLAERLLSLMET